MGIMNYLYNKIRLLGGSIKSPWRLKQLLGFKYQNTDFCYNKNAWLQKQLYNCPFPEAYFQPVCWENLRKFARSLKIKNVEEKINRRKVDFSVLTPPGVPYNHDEKYHRMYDPRIIVDAIYSVIVPHSVIDIGCGIGTFLKAFKDKGATKILGIDGDWVSREKLFKYINPDEFLVKDLQKKFSLDEKFDIAISLEVAEHLKEESAYNFIESLTKLSDTIIFSAATPLTWYDSSHLNCQWPDYWRKIFNQFGFEMHDVIRHIFTHDDIFSWYKTNMFLVTKRENAAIVSKFEEMYPRKKYVNRLTPVFYPQLY